MTDSPSQHRDDFVSTACQLDEPAQRVREPHLVDRLAVRFEEAWRAVELDPALRARGRDQERRRLGAIRAASGALKGRIPPSEVLRARARADEQRAEQVKAERAQPSDAA